MASNGFIQLGEMIAGGGIDREGARLEGLAAGSTINNRNANTTNALAQARLRKDEYDARQSLADSLEIGGNKAIADTIRAKGNPKQVTDAQLGQQEAGFRNTIADSSLPIADRQAAAQARHGQPLRSKDFLGPGGELFMDVFNPTAEGLAVTPTGTAQIDLDTANAERQRAIAAREIDRVAHPERYKNSTNFNFGGKSLSELVLPGGEGESVVPSNVDPSAALGVEGVFKNSVNELVDFFGGGALFEDTAMAQTTLSELAARTTLSMLADGPGGRQNATVIKLMSRYAEEPSELFRGTDLARHNLQTTLASLKRTKKRLAETLDLPKAAGGTPTRQGELVDKLKNVADTIADYEVITEALNTRYGPLAGTETPAATTTPGLPEGWTVTVEPQ